MPVLHTARYYETQTWDAAQCLLCPHQCSIAPSRQGKCGVRSNRNGVLHSMTYGKVADTHPVAIEEVPFFHYLPGTRWLPVASVGCTMHCPFCNTWRHSQTGSVRTRYVEPGALVEQAKQASVRGLVFMVNEPAVWHEYVIDVAREARDRELAVAVTTSGMWSTEPFAEAITVVDAFLFGFKGVNGVFWTAELGGLLEQARLNLEMAAGSSRHVETSYLVIEGLTDDSEAVDAFGQWLSEVDSRILVHVIGYRPDFQWDRPASTAEAIRRVAELLSNRLPYVYADDGTGAEAKDTKCPSCGRVVVSRSTTRGVDLKGLSEEACAGCGAQLPIVTKVKEISGDH